MGLSEHVSQGEGFDGRLFFHERRHQIHTNLIEYGFKSLKEPIWLDEWCGSLLNLLRSLWGLIKPLPYEFNPDDTEWKEFIAKHPKYKEMKKDKIKFRDVIEAKLFDVRNQIISAYVTKRDANNRIVTTIDIKPLTDIYRKLHKIQTEIADIEYKKKLDLPEVNDPRRAVEDF